MPKSTDHPRRSTGRRWIAPRTGGYRPGGEFSEGSPPPRPAAAVIPPKDSGGVVPENRK